MGKLEMPVCKVKIAYKSCPLPDVRAKVFEEFEKIRDVIKPGMTIAVAVGSRGISNTTAIVKAVIDCLVGAGAKPFIIPAMGSHGGATGEGQRAVLESYGITKESMGVDVISTMDVSYIGELDDSSKLKVYMSKDAFDADGVIVINRVKNHTDFRAPHESGLLKFLCIGLGKHELAKVVHSYGTIGLKKYIPLVAQAVLDTGHVLAGLAILEDGYDQTADLCFAKPDTFFKVDEEFHMRSREMMAQLPVESLDVLLVDNMGKDYSGTGIDTNVVGRLGIPGQPDGKPFCDKIAVLRLSEPSHGNASGIGLADVVPKTLVDTVDWDATYENMLTSGDLARGACPVVMPNEKDTVNAALKCCHQPDMNKIRFIRIRDTLHLDEIIVSRPIWEEFEAKRIGERISDFAPLAFDDEGRIADF